MKSVQFIEPGKFDIIHTDKPNIGDEDVLLQIKAVGICGTDLHIYTGKLTTPTPMVLGHEFVGDVVGVGKNVQHITIGEKAVAEHVIGCGICQYCQDGEKNLCLKPTTIGINAPGALAEYVAIPASLVYTLPQNFTYDQGVLVEPLSIAVYSLKKTTITKDSTVVVIGQGPVGLLLDQVVKAKGATVFGIDIVESRLQFAKEKQYIDEYVNANEDVTQKFKQLINSDGADVLFEVVGLEKTMEMAINLVRAGGQIVVLGVFGKPVIMDMMKVVKRELKIEGSWTCRSSFQQAIELLQNKIVSVNGLVTHRYPFTQTKQAFEDALHPTDDRIKTVIEFS